MQAIEREEKAIVRGIRQSRANNALELTIDNYHLSQMWGGYKRADTE